MTGRDYTQLNELKNLLKSIDLLEEYNQYPGSLGLTLSEIRRMSFIDLWRKYIKTNCYHFLLKDDSLLFFDAKNKTFIYISNPYHSVSFNDFLAEYGFEDDEEKYSLYEDYEQYLSELNIKEFPLIIRYDYDERSYNSGYHPVSHLHIGFGNETRLGTTKIMDIESFTYFVLRQIYPKYWQEIIVLNGRERRINSNKNKLVNIDASFYNSLDKLEMYLKY